MMKIIFVISKYKYTFGLEKGYPVKTTVLFIVGVILIIASCKRKPNPPSESSLVCTDENTIEPCKPAMDFFCFKPGSWWVYQEDSTGQKDSIWLGKFEEVQANAVRLKDACNCGYGKCLKGYNFSFENSTHHPFPHDYLFAYAIGSGYPNKNEPKGTSGIDEDDKSPYFLGSGYRFLFTDTTFDSPTGQYGNVERLYSLKVKDTTYKDIVHLYYPDQNNIADWLHEAWYARHVHLIKYRKYDGTNWSLIRYHVVQ